MWGGGDPRLREPALYEELGHVLAVGVVDLGPSLGAASDRDLGGVGQGGRAAGRLQFLHHEPPSGRSLEGEVGGDVGEFSQPLPELLPGRRRDPSAVDLPGLHVLPAERDLPAMQV
jgi:hypothetical protein